MNEHPVPTRPADGAEPTYRAMLVRLPNGELMCPGCGAHSINELAAFQHLWIHNFRTTFLPNELLAR